MSDTSIQTTPSALPAAPSTAVTAGPGAVPAPAARPSPKPRWTVYKAFKALASLRLTVVLFVLSLILVFYGTIAQIDAGIWTVVSKYFRWFWVWIPFQLNVQFGQVFLGLPKNLKIPGSFPFPGGWTLGTLLLINLVAAHAVRFKLNWKRSGIFLIHAGLIVLMVGELITGLFAKEARMSIVTGRASNYTEDFHADELVFTTPLDDKKEDVIAIPGSFLRKGGVIDHPLLPCKVEVHQYMVNSALRPVPPLLKGLPNNWTEAEGKANVWKTYKVAGGKQTAEFTVNHMPVNFGDLLANINRWRKQVGAEEMDEDTFAELRAPTFFVAGSRGKYFEIKGPKGTILLVFAPSGDTMWFYKLMGPGALVAAEKENFEKFLRSVRYSDPENLADVGDGLTERAVAQPEISGASTEQTVDVPSAYVTLSNKDTGEKIGTYLVSAFLVETQEVRIGNKVYNLGLRFKRTYKPYTIHLKSFTHEVYPGTDKPRNFASEVTVAPNAPGGEKRDARIYMNNPLRYEGETFYQSGYLPGDRGTILQVVRNPVWLAPYWACLMVGGGMLVHFGINLLNFLRRRAA